MSDEYSPTRAPPLHKDVFNSLNPRVPQLEMKYLIHPVTHIVTVKNPNTQNFTCNFFLSMPLYLMTIPKINAINDGRNAEISAIPKIELMK